MAARLAHRSYLFSRSTLLLPVNVPPHHVKGNSVVSKHVNDSLWCRVFCESRGTGCTKDSPVRVPVERLKISYSRSSGAGGQHVNKVSTKAEVRFHVQTADWLPEDVRQKILEKNRNRINKAGELQVTSELSRSQQRNLSDCIQKISAIITGASEKPHQPSEEDLTLRAARLERRNQERLKQKKIHSATKHSRKVDFD